MSDKTGWSFDVSKEPPVKCKVKIAFYWYFSVSPIVILEAKRAIYRSSFGENSVFFELIRISEFQQWTKFLNFDVKKIKKLVENSHKIVEKYQKVFGKKSYKTGQKIAKRRKKPFCAKNSLFSQLLRLFSSFWSFFWLFFCIIFWPKAFRYFWSFEKTLFGKYSWLFSSF